jgi:hypothetical protein
MAQKIVRIGGAAGCSGDSGIAATQLIRAGNLQYLIFDYLSELTMGVLARAKQKNTKHGYALDFVDVIRSELPAITSMGMRVVSNAGGVNPVACAMALKTVALELGIPVKIAVVTGDDIVELMESRREKDVRDLRYGQLIPSKFLTANVCLGALPIKKALDAGATIVVTGLGAGSAATLGALMHEFGWREDDYDKQSSGSLAGRILECGVQATGGLHTDWRLVRGWANIGYPIAEVAQDGTFVVTKPEGTGGLVDPAVISEQMLDKVGDPGRYLLPDVSCDFTQVQLTRIGEDRVAVTGAKGLPPTDTYKACATYLDGYGVSANLTFVGFDAAEKAQRISEALLMRTSQMMRFRGFGDYTATNIKILGAGSRDCPSVQDREAREIVSRIAVTHHEQRALQIFSREVAAVCMSCAPGAIGVLSRPIIFPVLKAFSFLLSKDIIKPTVEIDGKAKAVTIPSGSAHRAAASLVETLSDTAEEGDLINVPLVSLAYGRSGDKGDMANIAVIARRREFLPYIRKQVTAARTKEYLAHLIRGDVVRYDVPGIMAFNFVCRDTVDGGLAPPLRNDPSGRTYAQLLLSMPVNIPRNLIS